MSPKLRRRIAIVLTAVLFALPFFHYNFEFAQRTYNLYGRARPTAPGVIPLITFGVSLLITLQIIGYLTLAWLAVYVKERWLGPVRFQLQLRTGLVLTAVAAVFLYLNTNVQYNTSDNEFAFGLRYSFGFPETIYVRGYDGPLWNVLLTSRFLSNVACGLAALLVVALFCEYKLWIRPSGPIPIVPAVSTPPAHNLPLTTRERWFYAIPMWVCFVIFCYSSIPVFATVGFGEQYRMESAVALRTARRVLDLRAIYYGVILVGITAFYFSWVCRSRRAVFYFNFILLVLLYFFLLAVAMGIIGMFFKVSSLRKK